MSVSIKITNALLFALLILIATNIVSAWTGPTQTPPNGNVAAPVNVGTLDQIKNAGLGINSLAVYGNTILSGSGRYLNFGTTAGSGGYGFRDNAGIMQFKNSSGAWVAFPVCSNDGDTLSWNASASQWDCQAVATSSPGSQIFISSGTFTVPVYSTLTVKVWGGGGSGGGGGACRSPGDGIAGGQSRFNSTTPVVANGGTGGRGCSSTFGTGGTASGGDTNTTGGNGNGSSGSRPGGNSPNGGLGGQSIGANGSISGGGGAGGDDSESSSKGAGGGAGGNAMKTWTVGASGAPTVGSNITVTVGAGGGNSPENGGYGVRGEVQVTWN